MEHINKIAEYDIEKCPISGIDNEDLRRLLINFKNKCEYLQTSSQEYLEKPLVSIDEMTKFCEESVIEVHKYINEELQK